MSLRVGIQQYIVEYGHPPAQGSTSGDTQFETDDSQLMNTLRGRDASQNPRKIPFFTYKDARDPKNPKDGFDPAGNLLDPWGNPYIILLDTDQNGQITLHGEVIKANAVVWSYGPNGKPDLPNEGDDIISWK